MLPSPGHMRLFLFACALILCLRGAVLADDPPAPSGRWITGEVFAEGDQLLFRLDKPVKENSRGRDILLGVTSDAKELLLPLYAKAAEKHLTLRLYGELEFTSDAEKVGSKVVPTVEFITWKAHSPSDPDELPADQKVTPSASPHT